MPSRVYTLDIITGLVTVVIDNFVEPNEIVLNQDRKFVYVGDSAAVVSTTFSATVCAFWTFQHRQED